jgi:flagellar biogenesis protein FliO
MEYSDRKRTCSDRSAKQQLIEFMQLIFVLLLFGGMAWAVINIQHYDGYYTDGTL